MRPATLADHFHVIAPDYPGFGQSSAPDHTQFAYTFDHLSAIMTALWQTLDLGPAYIYVFDYGAPIGFRIAAAHPDWIRGIVSQNGNVYQAGLGPKWAERQDFWDHPTPAKRDSYRTAFAPATIRGQYLTGTAPHMVSPDGYTLDIAYTQTPGYAERPLASTGPSHSVTVQVWRTVRRPARTSYQLKNASVAAT
ncbi:alpha/beta fold hydrolase [Levilactobacillus yiduensis]|uniref:alpha/beta fold hydrolase n=1 Tax=Levilactobacillus yiduensis TaxID=2953880 RepID=UPI001FD686AD|nr:alpha/beta fold hydrolase [Levilactobacillus yiduensis]